jgi:CheY-like chemotaxis protein
MSHCELNRFTRKKGPYILILDDDTRVRQLVGRAVRKFLSRPVLEAASNAGALRLLDDHAIEGIIQDFQREGETALELCRELGKKKAGIPVLLYSGTPLAMIEEACEAVGVAANEYFPVIVEKPGTALLAKALRSSWREASDHPT